MGFATKTEQARADLAAAFRNGPVKQAKADAAANEARRAYADGRTMLVYNFNFSAWSKGAAAVSGLVPGAAERIEAIEAEGWRLKQMTHRTGDMLVLLFRRA